MGHDSVSALEGRLTGRRQNSRRRSDVNAAEIADRIADEVSALDPEWRFTYVNEAALNALRRARGDGLTREGVLGQNVWKMFPAYVGSVLYQKCHEAMREQGTVEFEAPDVLTDRWIEGRLCPCDEGLLVHTRDITERRRGEETRNELVRRLFAVQEDERRRLSRDLHDEFGQQLTALSLNLSALRRELSGGVRLGAHLASLEAIVIRLSSTVAHLARELRPSALDDLGLGAALTQYVNNWSKQFDIHAELHIIGIESRHMTNELDTGLYRILQEALNNIAKHARARHVSIVVQRQFDHVLLIVQDDGVGFNTKQALDAYDNGLGLVGMRERAMLLGGALEVESKRGRGTIVVARLPIPAGPDSK